MSLLNRIRTVNSTTLTLNRYSCEDQNLIKGIISGGTFLPHLYKLRTYGASTETLCKLINKFPTITHFEFRRNNFLNTTTSEFNGLFDLMFNDDLKVLILENFPVDNKEVCQNFCEKISQSSQLKRLELRKFNTAECGKFMRMLCKTLSQNSTIEHLSLPFIPCQYLIKLAFNKNIEIWHFSEVQNVKLPICGNKRFDPTIKLKSSHMLNTIIRQIYYDGSTQFNIENLVKMSLADHESEIFHKFSSEIRSCVLTNTYGTPRIIITPYLTYKTPFYRKNNEVKQCSIS